ncbi:transposase [Nonomuraea sp. NPDC049480]|uniref:transposase n=1 Tax=Nonomuraea sp. NPDC049480 TaxID=3364353 RepID=UPI003793814A
MSRFPTPGHLASWARFAPGVKESAGKKKGRGATGHGNPYLARVLGRRRWWPAGPTPSWASVTGASPADAAPNAPSSPSAAPS